MFATKILIAAGIAASSLAFTSAPANAATHIALNIGIPTPVVTYYNPAPPVSYVTSTPVVTYATPAPVCTTPVVITPAPVIIYSRPDFHFGFGFHNDRGDFRGHGDFHHDRR